MPAAKEKRLDSYTAELEKLRIECQQDFFTFMCVMNPYRYFGEIHRAVADWLSDPFGSRNKLLLLPRDHQKSYMLAMYVCWIICKDPTCTFLYLSATATLAEKQLYQIKQILTSDKYSLLWPEMLHVEEGRRDKWTNTEINVDHPLRAELGIRDSTVMAAGITKVTAGLHPQYIMSDDVVVRDNAYTEEGRQTLRTMYSFLASLESSTGWNIAAGTRYHDKDLYNDMIDMYEETYNKWGECTGSRKVYDIFERKVETNGVFLWPRKTAKDGKEYGFDFPTLATKKAKYLDKSQFYAQYYNNCNMGEGVAVSRAQIKYYDRAHLNCRGGKWYFKERRLYITAGMDLAFSLNPRADYTAIAAIGMDWEKNIFILEIIRFKTNELDVYFENMKSLASKWNIKKMLVEINVAGIVVFKSLQKRCIDEGVMIHLEPYTQKTRQGEKEERSVAILNPAYKEFRVHHPREGDITAYEEEILVMFPKHDDCRDAVTGAVSIATCPPRSTSSEYGGEEAKAGIIYNSFFGGVQGRGRRMNVR